MRHLRVSAASHTRLARRVGDAVQPQTVLLFGTLREANHFVGRQAGLHIAECALYLVVVVVFHVCLARKRSGTCRRLKAAGLVLCFVISSVPCFIT